MRKEYEVVIAGGGVYGLMIAHNLVMRGFGHVAVFEANVVGSGQSSRNSGGVRAQFGNEPTVRFMSDAISRWRRIPSELGYNILFSQDGYLFACYEDEDITKYRRARDVQNRNGIRTEWLEKEEVVARIPGINTNGLVGGNFHSMDGTLHHDAVISALYFSLRRDGVELVEHCPVRAVNSNGESIEVTAGEEQFTTQYFVNATASRVNELSSQLGLHFPVTPTRRELIATEPLRSMMKPMLVSLKYGVSIHQSLRGEYVGHTGVPEPENEDIKAGLDFLMRFSRDIIKLLPFLKYVRVVRQWAGTYDVTPDGSPVLGPTGVERYVVAAGSSGHGFMMSPAVGYWIADYIATGKVSDLLAPFLPDRFSRGALLDETLLSNSKVL
ncbi:MAG: FAD-binding oxidoreductase [Methanomassiliicoccales archaeon]